MRSNLGIVEPSFVAFATEFKAEWQHRFGDAGRLGATNCTIAVAIDRGPANGATEVWFKTCSPVDYVIIRKDLAHRQRIAGWALDL